MAAPKDDPLIIRFMSLFSELREIIDNDPQGLETLIVDDERLRSLCLTLGHAAISLQVGERSHRHLFTGPVDPKFISAWRDYEQRYASPLAGIFLFDLGVDLGPSTTSNGSELERLWEHEDQAARVAAEAIATVFVFAMEQTEDGSRYFLDGLVDSIHDGDAAWKKLVGRPGFDLRGIIRRRALVPFVLVPRHVSNQYGGIDKLSLFQYLLQVQEAFVFGVPFAAIALMRSVLEVMLKRHYSSTGHDLEELISNCRRLPAGAPRPDLHRLRQLANKILHFDTDRAWEPRDIESELLRLLYTLRALIEGAPVLAAR